MIIEKKYHRDLKDFIRDTRTPYKRFVETMEDPTFAASLFAMGAGLVFMLHTGRSLSDVALVAGLFYIWWLSRRGHVLPLKMPAFTKFRDPNEKGGKAQGILFLGNEKPGNDELWLSGKDAGTHVLYLGTTGAGKTEGLKSMVSNALTWGSGFIYIDGKADTNLWASIYALARRFGRDDDLFVLNYLTGNSDLGAVSNTINPFTTGSSSYLTNLLVSLMDEAKGENAMWKGRAVALMGALMPILTWRRDHLYIPLDVKVILDSISLNSIIRLSRDPAIPERIRNALSSTYLETLPGYIASAFDDDGNEAAPGPNDPPRDMSTVSQQHNFLSMQFTRALQSLSGDYWHIFGSQVADVVMQDIVLNRRILVVLIPSLEKSADEAANLGKIVTAAIKGMMGTTLGSSVEGDWSGVIDNKMSNSSSPFMTVFDEVGYYTTQGMAVMAAQARSLGFSLIFASQDIPSMEMRIKEEARSITANCNLKIFGKLEESIDTQNFFEKTVGKAMITEMNGMSVGQGAMFQNYYDQRNAQVTVRDKAGWGDLRDQLEGEVHMTWQSKVIMGRLFYAAPKRVHAMRVHKLLGVKVPEPMSSAEMTRIRELVQHLKDPSWTAANVRAEIEPSTELAALSQGFKLAQGAEFDVRRCGTMALAALAEFQKSEMPEEMEDGEYLGDSGEQASLMADEQGMPLIGSNYDDPMEEALLPPPSGELLAEPPYAESAMAYVPEPALAGLPGTDQDIEKLFEGLHDEDAAPVLTPERTIIPSDFHPRMSKTAEDTLKKAAERLSGAAADGSEAAE